MIPKSVSRFSEKIMLKLKGYLSAADTGIASAFLAQS